MANYVVTTRGKDGSLVERAYTANDRADLFKKLSADGVNAVRVREGTLGKKPRKSAASGAPSKGRGLIAAAIVILGVGAAIWFLMPGGEKISKSADEELISGERKDVGLLEKKQKKTPRDESVTPEKVVIKKDKPTKAFEVVNGMIMLSNGKIVPTNKIAKARVPAHQIKRAKFAIFEHSTDNEFAALLTLPPGQSLVGGPLLHKNYKEDFLRSLKTPIVIKEDDSEEEKELKTLVLQVREDMKQALDRGEDLAAIVRAAYDDAQKLEMYKMDIKAQVDKAAKEQELSRQDVEDLINAANIMLEEKGIAPMKLTPIAKARLRGILSAKEAVSEDLKSRQAE